MKKPINSTRQSLDLDQPYVMRIADLLSDDPMLVGLLGSRFKVIAVCDREAKRVTYSFRCADDAGPDEWDAKQV